jgi:OOP family OmpA-OmpF porin
MKQIIVSALITAALAAPLAAQAETAYVGGNIGRAEQKLDVAGYSTKDNTTGYKLVGGVEYTKNFGLEVGYADLREVSISGNGARLASKPQVFYVAGTATLPIDEQFSVFGKAGIATAHTKISASMPGFSTSGTDNETTGVIGVGAAFQVNKNVSIVAEYEYFGKVAKDEDASLKASLLSVGVRYKF